MIQRGTSAALLVTGDAVLAGCASGGGSKDEERVIDASPYMHTIIVCETTSADIRKQLAQPNRDGLLQGRRVLIWGTA